MKKNLVVCADHQIGADVIDYIMNRASPVFNVIEIVTTEENNNGFWTPLSDIVDRKKLQVCNSSDSLKKILQKNKEKVDYIFLISWKYILSSDVLEIPEIGILNLHYSLLPDFRGVYPVNNAIINGELFTGISFHWVDSNEVDGGEVLLQGKVDIDFLDDASTLLYKLDDLALSVFEQIWTAKEPVRPSKVNVPKRTLKTGYCFKSQFERDAEINLTEKFTLVDFLNLCKGRTFQGKTDLFFFDNSGRKIYLNVSLEERK